MESSRIPLEQQQSTFVMEIEFRRLLTPPSYEILLKSPAATHTDELNNFYFDTPKSDLLQTKSITLRVREKHTQLLVTVKQPLLQKEQSLGLAQNEEDESPAFPPSELWEDILKGAKSPLDLLPFLQDPFPLERIRKTLTPQQQERLCLRGFNRTLRTYIPHILAGQQLTLELDCTRYLEKYKSFVLELEISPAISRIHRSQIERELDEWIKERTGQDPRPVPMSKQSLTLKLLHSSEKEIHSLFQKRVIYEA